MRTRTCSLFLFLFCLICPVCSFAQSSVTGFLRDSADNSPVAYATVAVLSVKDSNLVNFGLTDEKGGFDISRLPLNQPLRLVVSHVLYRAYRYDFRFDTMQKKNLDTILLKPKDNMLQEIHIHWEAPPILIRNDTVEFNADAFVNRPGSVVEDLLKRIPGITFDEEGRILVNGKQVSRITIDSKQFFSEDPSILLKNLPAKAIEKVQVTDSKDDRGLPSNDGTVTINLTLKSWAKTGHFGKAYAGYGTDQRYESGAIWNFFRDTLQISVLGYGNNLSNAGFSYSDLYQLGGFNRSSNRRTIWYSDGRISMDGASFGGGRGITESGGGGFNLNYDLPKKLKLNTSYFLGFSRTNYQETMIGQTSLGDSILRNENQNSELKRIANHALKLNLKWTPDTVHVISIRPLLIYEGDNTNNDYTNQNRYNEANPSRLLNNSQQQTGRWEFNNDIFIDRRIRKWSYSLSHFLSTSNNKADGLNLINSLLSDSAAVWTRSRQQRTITGREFNTSNFLEFRYRPNDTFSIFIEPTWEWQDNQNNTLVFEQDSQQNGVTMLLLALSTEFREKRNSMGVNTGLELSFREYHRFVFNLSYRLLALDLSNDLSGIHNSRLFKPLNARVTYELEKGNSSLEISYEFDNELPYSWYLLDFTDNRNINRLQKGNPNLGMSSSNAAGAYYRFGLAGGKLYWNGRLSGTITSQPVIDVVSYLESGASLTTRENLETGKSNKEYSSSNSLSYTVKTGKWSHRPGMSIYYYNSSYYSRINDRLVNAISHYFSPSLSYALSIKDKLDVKGSYAFGYNQVNTKELSSLNTRFTIRISGELWWAVTEKNWLEGRLGYSRQRQFNTTSLPNNFALLNLSYTRLMLKENRGQLRLSVFDALGQNRNINRVVEANSVTDKRSNVVTRYVMISFVYNMSKFQSRGTSKRGYEFW